MSFGWVILTFVHIVYTSLAVNECSFLHAAKKKKKEPWNIKIAKNLLPFLCLGVFCKYKLQICSVSFVSLLYCCNSFLKNI